MTKTMFALNFFLKYYAIAILVILITAFFEVEGSASGMSFVILMMTFTWSSYVYISKNERVPENSEKNQLVGLGFLIMFIPSAGLLIAFNLLGIFPMIVVVTALIGGGLLGFAALYLGFRMAKTMYHQAQKKKTDIAS